MERQEYNYVMGFDNQSGKAVMSPDETVKLIIDHSKPITLKRAKEIFKAACELSGRDLYKISIELSAYSKTPGNECGDAAEECLIDKKWVYTLKTNSLVIWDKGEPVYANDNGVICTDQVALYDTLC